MKIKFSIVTFLIVLAISGSALFAQDKTGVNRGEKTSDGSTSESAEQTQRLSLAYSSAKYGRSVKSAEAMIVAAKIVKEINTQKLDVEKKSDGTAEKGEKTAKTDMSFESLIKDAKTFAGKNKGLLTSIKAVEQTSPGRGAIGGPKRTVDAVNPNSIDNYKISFRGDEQAVVVVSGDGDTDLDLYIYDENGNLIASDDDRSDDCVVRFYPKWSGNFLVRIRNRGNVYNKYVMATN